MNKIKALVALVEFLSSEKGWGWIIPFQISLYLIMLVELNTKLLNSSMPTIKKKKYPK